MSALPPKADIDRIALVLALRCRSTLRWRATSSTPYWQTYPAAFLGAGTPDLQRYASVRHSESGRALPPARALRRKIFSCERACAGSHSTARGTTSAVGSYGIGAVPI